MDASSGARGLRWGLVLAGLVTGVVVWLLVGVVAGTADAQAGEAQPPPSLVIVARSDNPADALRSIDPDLVVLAGGAAALSEGVEAAVNELGYATRRAAGADRHETAALVSALLAEFSTGRPVLTGTAVTDQVIPG